MLRTCDSVEVFFVNLVTINKVSIGLSVRPTTVKYYFKNHRINVMFIKCISSLDLTKKQRVMNPTYPTDRF